MSSSNNKGKVQTSSHTQYDPNNAGEVHVYPQRSGVGVVWRKEAVGNKGAVGKSEGKPEMNKQYTRRYARRG